MAARLAGRLSIARVYDRVPRPVQALGVALNGAYLEWLRYGGEFGSLLR